VKAKRGGENPEELMKLAHSQRRTLLGYGLMRSPSAKKGLRKLSVCMCREAGQRKERLKRSRD